MKTFEEKWQIILENFGWERVYKTMKALDWDWCIDKKNNLYGIPTIKTLQNSAKRLLKDAWDEKKGISSGGFTATYEDGDLALDFTVEAMYSGDYA